VRARWPRCGRHLEAKRVEPATIDVAVLELIDQRYLDDARYAEQFADDRRRLDGWGSERIARKLGSLGVDREHCRRRARRPGRRG
jgi:regulatory protein